jgi:putative heme-binding domain-containing protein
MDSRQTRITLVQVSKSTWGTLWKCYSSLVQLKVPAVLALSVVCFAQQCLAQENVTSQKNPFAGDANAVEAGRLLFRMSCAGCHGLHATGGRGGPDLTRGTYSTGDADRDLYAVISNGVPGTEMPSFREPLDDSNIWRLVTYVRSLSHAGAAPIKGDRVAGEKLFWGKGSCGQCHRVGVRGIAIGPDLTRAGKQRSLAYLRESIVSPDADLTPGFATIVVVTRDGTKITGVEKGYDNFSARLIDLSGRYYSFLKDNVTSMGREYRSLMPSNYGRMFNPHELDDLLAYLASLGGEQ